MKNTEDITSAFSSFFAHSNNIVGNEANYQTILHNALTEECEGSVYREYRDSRVGRGGIDVVMCNKTQEKLLAAFEIKGGAYNVRNALRDTFTVDGYCKDMDRLKGLVSNETEAWMVCIDATELGRVMSWKKLQGAIDHVRQRGIGLAYYAQGNDKFLVVQPCGEKKSFTLKDVDLTGVDYDSVRNLITSERIHDDLSQVRNSFNIEADIVAQMYRIFVNEGLSQKQISLETYFGFAPGNGMQQRPDICIYEPRISGRFNLYPKGDSKQSNDPLKLQSVRCVIEVKGGLPLAKKSEKAIIKSYETDLAKLKEWKAVISKQQRRLQIVSNSIDYILFAVDVRSVGLSPELINEVREKAAENGIVFNYMHLPI